VTWIKQLLSRRRLYDELSDEIREHLEERMEELVARGVPRREASAAARREFGNVTLITEDSRSVWRWSFVENMLMDIRYGLRMLRKSSGFTIVAIVTLALGIGANAAIFSVSDAVLLKLLPAKNPRQLVYFRLRTPENQGSSFSRTEFEQFRDASRSFAGMLAFDSTRVVLNADGQSDFILGQSVSGNFFSLLRIDSVLGRTLTNDDEQTGRPGVAVISFGYWKRRFASDSSVVGKSVTLKGVPFTIVGVAPEQFRGILLGDSVDIWVPLSFWETLRLNDHLSLGVMARMKPGADEKQASAELTLSDQQFTAAALGSKISPQEEREVRARSIELVPGGRGLIDLPDELPQSLLVLTTVVGLVLLIACANVANLLLARAVSRQKEIALRLALGAPRTRLFRQLLTESLLLALAGGALGLLFATASTDCLARLLSDDDSLQALNVHTDVRTLCFALGVSLFTCLLFGIAPAFWATRMEANAALKGVGSSQGANTRHLRPRKLLVISQVSLSVVLLVGAGLLLRSLQRLSAVDTGFRQENVLLVSIYPTQSGYEGARELGLYERVQERVSAMPGVLSASISRFTLLPGGNWTRVASHAVPASGQESELKVSCNPVAPHFFATMGIPLILGRDFTGADGQAAPRVTVVSESFARKYFPNEDPLGKPITFKGNNAGEQIVVVGIVKGVKAQSLWEQEPAPQMYIPVAQAPADLLGQVTMEVRTAIEPTTVVTAVREAMRDLDSDLPLVRILTQKAHVEASLQGERSLSTLSTLFGSLALLLACLGLYGIAAFSVATRTWEIGIRMALGARSQDVHRMVMRQGTRLAVNGVVVGVAAAFVVSRILANLLYGISGTDALIYAAVSLLLVLVAMAACYIPARRAARVDPMVALRYE
jgi:predicted permease